MTPSPSTSRQVRLEIETGTAEIKVVGDIIAGSGNTFQFSLRRASDARFVDTDLNQPILATRDGGSSFSARSATSATVDSGTVSTVKANSSQSSNVALGATNVKWATFELRAAGEDVKVESLDVQANTFALTTVSTMVKCSSTACRSVLPRTSLTLRM